MYGWFSALNFKKPSVIANRAKMASILRKDFVFLCQNRLKCVCSYPYFVLFCFLGLASEVIMVFAYMLHLQMACDFEAFIAVKTMWFWIKAFLLCFPPPRLDGGAFQFLYPLRFHGNLAAGFKSLFICVPDWCSTVQASSGACWFYTL